MSSIDARIARARQQAERLHAGRAAAAMDAVERQVSEMDTAALLALAAALGTDQAGDGDELVCLASLLDQAAAPVP